jgi:hypothetical protein
MREIIFLKEENPKMRKNKVYFEIFGTAISILLFAVFFASCSKETSKDQQINPLQTTSVVVETFPANQADTVVINPVVTVTLKSAISPSEVSASTITLKQGTANIQGTVSYSGSKATFTPSTDLKPGTKYTATITTVIKNGSEKAEHSWTFTTGKERHDDDSDKKLLSIVSVVPLNNATSVPVTIQPIVTFKDGMSSAAIKALNINLNQGTTNVLGTITYSDKTATFKPSGNLLDNTLYTVTVTFGSKSNGDDDDDDDEHSSAKTYSWSFTTAGGGVDTNAPSVLSVIPANNALSVVNTSKVTVTFSEAMNASTISSTTFTLKQGLIAVAGSVTYSGTTATFTPTSSLMASTIYSGTITTGAKDAAGNALASNYIWSFTTAAAADVTPPTVLSVVPANNTTAIANSIHPSVTFSEAMTASTINTTNFTLKQGLTNVAGTVSYSGTTATFTPSVNLMANTVYMGTVTTGAKDAAGNALATNYTWSFTTSATADVTPPTVLSVVPANNAIAVVNSIHPAVTFSEAMTASTINTTNFTLKQGSTSIAGTVSYSGTTATFTPSGNLMANTIYTGTITTAVKDAAGNSLASNYIWNFTTAAAADVTPPTVLSVVPVNGATSIAINSNVTAIFSEAMNSSTITSTTFTLKQGATAVAGTVTYSGTTATFNPTSDLAGNLVYTATITTGAKDAAGNSLVSNYTWSFTTITVAPVVSFASQVLPILQSKCMPCHGASSPSAGKSITNYATVSVLSNAQIDNSGMYPKMGVTPAEQAIIKAWIAAGRLNN